MGTDLANSVIVADDVHLLDDVPLRALQEASRADGAAVLAAPDRSTQRNPSSSSSGAAAGQSSREIARGASLSLRTVDSHLNAAYKKLAIHGRDDLRAIYDEALADLPPELPTPLQN